MCGTCAAPAPPAPPGTTPGHGRRISSAAARRPGALAQPVTTSWKAVSSGRPRSRSVSSTIPSSPLPQRQLYSWLATSHQDFQEATPTMSVPQNGDSNMPPLCAPAPAFFGPVGFDRAQRDHAGGRHHGVPAPHRAPPRLSDDRVVRQVRLDNLATHGRPCPTPSAAVPALQLACPHSRAHWMHTARRLYHHCCI